MSWFRGGWAPYVPVAVRRARAMKKMEKLRRKGLDVQPVEIQGRKIAGTFWGSAWCQHLERFSDFENRLPRGRTYVRNGSVCHLEVAEGEVSAMVSGSSLYEVKVRIRELAPKKWNALKTSCSGEIGSLLELLQGRLSDHVMTAVTDRRKGLFPLPGEISLECSCPDWATMCKHVAATLYGVGARLDHKPELLFTLRGVNHEELIEAGTGSAAFDVGGKGKARRRRIAEEDLGEVFGIDISEDSPSYPRKGSGRPARRRPQKGPRKRAAAGKASGPGAGRNEARAPGRRARGGKRKCPGRKSEIKPKAPKPVAAKRRKSTPGTARVRVTGRAVARLRAKFDMNRSEFARLLGVSVPSVANWEKRPGELNLQARTLAAWRSVRSLSKRRAREAAGLAL